MAAWYKVAEYEDVRWAKVNLLVGESRSVLSFFVGHAFFVTNSQCYMVFQVEA